MDKKEENGQNELIGVCILLNVNEHKCTNICNMTVQGSVGTEWVDLLRLKKLSKNEKMPVRGMIGTIGKV